MVWPVFLKSVFKNSFSHDFIKIILRYFIKQKSDQESETFLTYFVFLKTFDQYFLK